jgi:hypothetical protein
MGKAILFGVLGFIAGFVTFFAGFMLTEVICGLFHPVPAESHKSMEAMRAIVKTYPDWVLGIAVGGWGFTVMAAAWIATRIGGRIAGGLLSVTVLILFYCNLYQFPYPFWFKAAEIVSLPVMLLVGFRLALPSLSSKPDTPAPPQSN